MEQNNVKEIIEKKLQEYKTNSSTQVVYELVKDKQSYERLRKQSIIKDFDEENKTSSKKIQAIYNKLSCEYSTSPRNIKHIVNHRTDFED